MTTDSELLLIKEMSKKSKKPLAIKILDGFIVLWLIWCVIVTLFFGWHIGNKPVTEPLIHITQEEHK